MKVFIERGYSFLDYQIFIFNDTHQWVLQDGLWNQRKIDRSEQSQPTLTMSPDMLEAFARAAIDKLPVESTVGTHLKDAIAVRDRLFTYLEFVTGKGTAK